MVETLLAARRYLTCEGWRHTGGEMGEPGEKSAGDELETYAEGVGRLIPIGAKQQETAYL